MVSKGDQQADTIVMYAPAGTTEEEQKSDRQLDRRLFERIQLRTRRVSLLSSPLNSLPFVPLSLSI